MRQIKFYHPYKHKQAGEALTIWKAVPWASHSMLEEEALWHRSSSEKCVRSSKAKIKSSNGVIWFVIRRNRSSRWPRNRNKKKRRRYSKGIQRKFKRTFSANQKHSACNVSSNKKQQNKNSCERRRVPTILKSDKWNNARPMRCRDIGKLAIL